MIFKLTSTVHNRTTAYRPEANGLTERLNRHLADMMSHFVSSNHRNWDEILPFVTFAYNSSRQESMRFSPFELIFGREPNFPIDVALNTNNNYVKKQSDHINKMRGEALEYLKQSQIKNKELYDKKHRSVKFKPGEYVYVKTPTRKVGLSEKLLHQFYGPYKVIKQVTPVDYLIENHRPESKKKLTRDVVHVYRMKKFIERNEYFADDFEELRSVSPPDTISDETVRTEDDSLPADVLDDRELMDIFFDAMIDDHSDIESDTTEIYDLETLENIETPEGGCDDVIQRQPVTAVGSEIIEDSPINYETVCAKDKPTKLVRPREVQKNLFLGVAYTLSMAGSVMDVSTSWNTPRILDVHTFQELCRHQSCRSVYGLSSITDSREIANLPELPYHIWKQIFSYLCPFDIVKFSRHSRQFKRLAGEELFSYTIEFDIHMRNLRNRCSACFSGANGNQRWQTFKAFAWWSEYFQNEKKRVIRKMSQKKRLIHYQWDMPCYTLLKVCNENKSIKFKSEIVTENVYKFILRINKRKIAKRYIASNNHTQLNYVCAELLDELAKRNLVTAPEIKLTSDVEPLDWVHVSDSDSEEERYPREVLAQSSEQAYQMMLQTGMPTTEEEFEADNSQPSTSTHGYPPDQGPILRNPSPTSLFSNPTVETQHFPPTVVDVVYMSSASNTPPEPSTQVEED
ncbi:pol polyprotein-like protein [Leptotrombidium deliense]|uniref:Pol polyprotein-like protein n=1 Tax=Leptotrombidium deliense TaxID=299467 RepID=A0A443S5S8_9ACAR|nr:pol polyprotein-like protein [Leptotrombidium deliense]